MSKPAYHYETIKDALIFMVDHKKDRASLKELSAHVGLSAGRLQKVFTQWVGITPKQFERYLSVQYAKKLLAEHKTLLDASLQSGLSSSGRLHDLFVDIEAMTPGEYQNGGAALTIGYSVFPTAFGWCLVASTCRGICNIFFADAKEDAVQELYAQWNNAKLKKASSASHHAVNAYLRGISPDTKIKLHLHGTNFQIKVWEALLSIKEGEAASYKDIATYIREPRLSRRVGQVIGENPIAYLIPCHRVLRSTGEISGYRWGVERKRAMLAYEAHARHELS